MMRGKKHKNYKKLQNKPLFAKKCKKKNAFFLKIKKNCGRNFLEGQITEF